MTKENGKSPCNDCCCPDRDNIKKMPDKPYELLLIGNPNVGKSVIFGRLTGKYAAVSNYPGTTVDIMTGNMSIGKHHSIKVTDTPGLYDIGAITEEERVTKKIIFSSKPDIVLHVTDAKNITRMLPLTLELMEAGLPVILVLNMYDELTRAGLSIEASHLEHDLGIPVVVTTASTGGGIENLGTRILAVAEGRYNVNETSVCYGDIIEGHIGTLSNMMVGDYNISKRAISLLLLQGDKDTLDLVSHEAKKGEIRKFVEDNSNQSLKVGISEARYKKTECILEDTFIVKGESKSDKVRSFFDKLTMLPIPAFFVAAAVLYFGFYKFVGGFGAGYLVDLIEGNLFETFINPYVDKFFYYLFNDGIFFSLFAGDYGIVTLGIRYAVAIVLPIVFTFFLMFSVLEDSGYLPRLSMSLNNLLKRIGLSGRSLIPLILGLGCGTMATVVTRTLETTRERLIVTFLLALAVPCAAQMGVILGVLGGSGVGIGLWAVTILVIFIIAGFIMDRVVKGDKSAFFMELPPLRIPKLSNILFKTFNRMKWYALEVIPIFMFASVLIWIGKVTKIFDYLAGVMSYPAKWAGLPDNVGEIFLYGFFRRDFGAAGLYDMQSTLSVRQLVVAAVILTLFVPCVAQFAVMIKERGVRTAIYIFATVIPFAFLTGVVLNKILIAVGFA